jgi:hypothetical protein
VNQLIEQAIAELKATTLGHQQWVARDYPPGVRETTRWGKGLALLQRALDPVDRWASFVETNFRTPITAFRPVKAERITFPAQQQVAGNALQLWGTPGSVGRVRVPLLLGEDLQGRMVDTNLAAAGVYDTVSVEYARHRRVLLNPLLAGGQVYDPRGGVRYGDIGEAV